jgi:mannosyltransferase OCH1-like enzyme
MFRYATIIFLSLSAIIQAGELPDYDGRCRAMYCRPAEITSTDYFYQPVPKNVHQIWFGDQSRLSRRKPDQWITFCKKFGYTYHLWTERDDTLMQSFMLPQNFALMLEMRQRGNYWGASDILRAEIIKHFGGIYIDCDFFPPSNAKGLVDFQDLINFHGLTLMTEHAGRNIGSNAAVFVANGLIISSPHHPVITSVVEQVYENTRHWQAAHGTPGGTGEAAYCTGPFLLNRVLNGCFNLVPCTFFEKHHMDDR